MEARKASGLDGRFVCELLEWDIRDASTGTAQFVVLLRIAEGVHEGMRHTYYGALTEAAFPYTARAMKACGWRGKQVSTLRADIRSGTLVEAVIGPDRTPKPGTSKFYTRVQFINPVRSIARTDGVLAADRKRALAGELQAMVDMGMLEQEAADPVTGAPFEDKDGDDVPF